MITAEPGMGKTCSLALLALKWVERSGEFLPTNSRSKHSEIRFCFDMT